jgi:hypothetical protein
MLRTCTFFQSHPPPARTRCSRTREWESRNYRLQAQLRRVSGQDLNYSTGPTTDSGAELDPNKQTKRKQQNNERTRLPPTVGSRILLFGKHRLRFHSHSIFTATYNRLRILTYPPPYVAVDRPTDRPTRHRYWEAP